MVSEELFTAYSKAIDGVTTGAADAARRLTELVAQLPPGERMDAARAGYRALVWRYGSMASRVALEFYQQQRADVGVTEPYEPEEFLADTDGLTDLDVREAYAASDVAGKLADRAARRALESADRTIADNAIADPHHPKFALVPRVGACAWCRFLGSKGFYYSERGMEGARHDRCKCEVVADHDRDDPKCWSYDPDGLQDEYRKARQAVEGDARAEWDAMSRDERRAWADAHETHGRSAYDVFLRNKYLYYMESHPVDGRRTKAVSEGRGSGGGARLRHVRNGSTTTRAPQATRG